MKTAVIFALTLLLAGCALSTQEAMKMSPTELCGYPFDGPEQAAAIKTRKLDCRRILREEKRREIAELGPVALCMQWRQEGLGEARPLVDHEVKARKLNCPEIIEAEAQYSLMQQELSKPKRRTHTTCNQFYGTMTCNTY